MNIKVFLNSIRKEEDINLTAKQRVVQVLAFFALGILLGLIAKSIDGISSSSRYGYLISIFSNICSRIGIWVLIATIIAVFSRTPKTAAINVFVFFIAMLMAYYIYSMKLFGFFPRYYFLRWGRIALVSPLAAYIVWYSRGEGWLAALSAALPIGLLASQGYRFIRNLAAIPGFDFFAAITLYFILARKKYQPFRVLPLALVFMFLLRKFELLAYFIGDL